MKFTLIPCGRPLQGKIKTKQEVFTILKKKTINWGKYIHFGELFYTKVNRKRRLTVIKYKKGKTNVVVDALSRRHTLFCSLGAQILGFDNIRNLYDLDEHFL